jgi:hypothetical protein
MRRTYDLAACKARAAACVVACHHILVMRRCLRGPQKNVAIFMFVPLGRPKLFPLVLPCVSLSHECGGTVNRGHV